MQYYVLEYQYPGKGFISGGATFVPALSDYYDPNHTELSPFTNVKVTLDSRVRKLDVDFFYTGNRATVVSDTFKQLLEQSNVVAQFIPAQIYYHNHTSVPEIYWIAHALQSLDCVDYEQSHYAGKAMVLRSIDQPSRRIAKGFEQIILDESSIEGNEFFTLDYTYISNPIISERLYQEIKKHKLKIHTTPIEQFRP
ncbi:imm11 family protein [Paenibacillus nicotianae]|uniref:Imm11 family protein n=1 Tax=Paenibacillus nicotianae TaxID=1526551 RepID=A0ABW4UV56_9BACL